MSISRAQASASRSRDISTSTQIPPNIGEYWLGISCTSSGWSVIAQACLQSHSLLETQSAQDENLDVIYTNEVLERDLWHTFSVGKTRFNDEALRQAGQAVLL